MGLQDYIEPIAKVAEIAGKEYSIEQVSVVTYVAWGRCSVGRVRHGPPKILVGWATMHLAPPIIGLYVR